MRAPVVTDLTRLRSFLVTRLGLAQDLPDAELAELLADRLHDTAMTTAEDYLARLDQPIVATRELTAWAERLTVGESLFFRHQEQLEAFVADALPAAMATQQRPGPLRILSAGCAGGEEPYTLAILIRERARSLAQPPEIIGIDVNPRFLAKARKARYSTWSLRNTPPALRRRYFHETGGQYELDERIRAMVRFELRNLLVEDAAFWAPDAFDIIFCRNVLIYFAEHARRATLARFARSLRPCGFLFLGHAEALLGRTPAFHLRQHGSAFYHQKQGPACTLPQLPARSGVADRTPAGPLAVPPARHPPPPPTSPAPNAGTYHVGVGAILDLLHRERFAEALSLWQALPADAKADPDVHLVHALLLLNRGDLDGAEEACRHALALDPRHAGAYYLLAVCRQQLGDLEMAETHDRTAMYLDPSFAMPSLHLGLLAKQTGRRAMASALLQQALSLLAAEPAARLLLYGGGFGRRALMDHCRAELRRLGGRP